MTQQNREILDHVEVDWSGYISIPLGKRKQMENYVYKRLKNGLWAKPSSYNKLLRAMYFGEVDKNYKPHGYGETVSDYRDRYAGMWCHGKMIGPGRTIYLKEDKSEGMCGKYIKKRKRKR